MVTTMVGRDGVRPVRVGMLLAVVSMLVGFGIGGAFGGFEHELEGYLKARGRGVADKVYHGRTADIKKAVKGGMKYLKRAHMHGGAIGAGVLGLCLMMVFIDRFRTARVLTSTALGAASLGYTLYWMFAGLRAPSLGGTGPAKKSLEWLAVPCAGLLMVGILAALLLLVLQMVLPRQACTDESSAS